jgi:DNA-directed RNA polymerase subunit RPC12/RpoP
VTKVPDYDLSNPATWVVIQAPSVDPSFERGLVEIAGPNPFGRPVLRLVWGATHRDGQATDGGLKYYLCTTEPTLCGFEFSDGGEQRFVKRLEDVPTHVLIPVPKYEAHQLGERRFFVEQWRSAEFLRRSGRYRQTWEGAQTTTYFECRNCGSFVPAPPETAGLDIGRQCPSCGSRRVSPVDVRADAEGPLLKPLPAEGAYDYFCRVQNADGSYRHPDGEVLQEIAREWRRREGQTFGERTAELNETRGRQTARGLARRRELWQPDNMMRKEESLCQQ